MARPRKFDQKEALEAGLKVFWTQGFNGTTTDDLAQVMRIGRQSFYATFGDKRRCYLEALAAYMTSEVSCQLEVLGALASTVEALRGYLYSVVDWPSSRRAVGCMAMNALCEFGMSDPEVAALIAHDASRVEGRLITLVQQAKASGEVSALIDETQTARFLLCVRAGMVAGAKSGLTPGALASIADFTIDRLLTAEQSSNQSEGLKCAIALASRAKLPS